MRSGSIRISSPGTQTTIQELPGRLRYRGHGVSAAGPLDDFSFRVANFLVGNQPGQASVEIQFSGPEIVFEDNRIIAICGADNRPVKNRDTPLELWRSHVVRRGDKLSFGYPRTGARTYLAISGGIDVPSVIGSRATDMRLALGGVDGRALRQGDIIGLGPQTTSSRPPQKLRAEYRPLYANIWDIGVVRGPYDDFFSESDIQLFLGAPWRVTGKSDRMGYWLERPSNQPLFDFSDLARSNAAENGGEATSIISYGAPVGGINICGQTPIVLLNDSFSVTGYICPFTVVSEDIRKIGQARPGDTVYFHEVSPTTASRDEYFFSRLSERFEEID